MPRRPDAKGVSFHPENARIPFADYLAGGWSLEIECWSCKVTTYIPPAGLVARFGAGGSTGSIYGRLTCARCGVRHPAVRAVTFPSRSTGAV